MNRSTRIIILLVIDVLFFFIELIVGAQPPRPHTSFHLTNLSIFSFNHMKQVMPSGLSLSSPTPSICSSKPFPVFSHSSIQSPSSDVMSLVVALYAIKVSIPRPFNNSRLLTRDSSQIKLTSMPVIPMAGIAPRSSLPLSTASSSSPSASPYFWKPWKDSSVPLVSLILYPIATLQI